MEKVEIDKKVIGIIREQLFVQGVDVKLESHLLNELGADSLDMVELVMTFEEGFDMDITDEDFEKIRTVGDISNLIEKGLQ